MATSITASLGSMTRRKITAFTFKVTLSRVMMSCGGTSSASWRSETRTIWSIGAKTRMSPALWRRGSKPSETEDDAAFVFSEDLDGAEDIKNHDGKRDKTKAKRHDGALRS